MFIKGINYCSFPGGLEGTCSIENSIKLCVDNNYKALELNFSVNGVINPFLDKKKCKKIKESVNSNNLVLNSCTSGMSWAYNPTSLDKNIRVKSLDLHKAAIRTTSYLGANSLLFVPGIVNSPISKDSIPYEIAVNYAQKCIFSLLKECQTYGVKLCLENVWNGLFLSPLELRTLLFKINNDFLGLYFDVGNVLRYHQDPADWIMLLSEYIKLVQIKDFKNSIGTLEGFCDLLSGDVNWSVVINSLKKINYRGTIIAEMLPWDKGILERTSVAMDIILKS